MRAWWVIACVGCWGGGAPEPESPPVVHKTSNGAYVDTVARKAGCPDRGPLAAGRCAQNSDCKGEWMECSPFDPSLPYPPQPRPTGMGKLFGTDDVECDRNPPNCSAGSVPWPKTLANACPSYECKPPCTATSCAAGEVCDVNTHNCRASECSNEGWKCAADMKCQHSIPGADKHGCTPKCPAYGFCVKYGPPIP